MDIMDILRTISHSLAIISIGDHDKVNHKIYYGQNVGKTGNAEIDARRNYSTRKKFNGRTK